MLLSGKSDMKIKRIETFTEYDKVHPDRGSKWSFVKITADSGAEGFGQIAPWNGADISADISATVLHQDISRWALGKDPYDIGGLFDTCIEKNLKYPWSYLCWVLAGLDTALWDLRGKVENKSVCEMLGGEPRAFPVYGSSISRQISPAEEAKRMAKLRDTHGFGAFKIRIGSWEGYNKDAWPGRTEEIVPTVRKALGDNVGLMVDANCCYTVDKAIEVGRMLEQYNVIHYEEPCPYREFEWTAKVTETLEVPVAGGEQNNDLFEWRRMIALPAFDIVQPDVCYMGGLARTLRVVEMAHKAKLLCMPHSSNLSMITVFTLHLMGAIPNAGAYVEYSIEDDAWTQELYEPVLKVRDGKVAIPNGPGWGVTINKLRLEGAKYQVSE